MNRREGLKLIAAAPLAMAAPMSFSATTAWTRGADMPFATQEIYPARYGGELIVAGGIGNRAGLPYFPDRCIAYCPSTDSWREHSRLPVACHHGALVAADSRLFQMGGFNGSYTRVWRMTDAVLEFVQGEWKAVFKLPQKQAEGVVATSANGRIHVVTGQSPKGNGNAKRSHHREIHEHWSWHPDDTKWQEHAPIPTARNSATGAWVEDQLIIAGGRTASGNLDATEIYSLKTDSWRSAAPLPLPQAGTASIATDDGLIVFGGEIFRPIAAVFKEVWQYTLSADSWRPLPVMPTPRHGLGAIKFGSKAYVVGGARRPSGSGTSKAVEILDLDAI